MANTKLFIPQKDIDQLRFINASGEITYFQKRDGSLNLSKHFNIKKIIDSKNENTQYQIQSTSKGNIIILKDDSFFERLNIRKDFTIFLSKVGSYQITEVGKGKSPSFHLDDTWLSFFQAENKNIHIHFLPIKEKKFKIQLNNTTNPYFLPQTAMLDPENIYYTDLNNSGVQSIIKFNVLNKDFSLQFRSKSIAHKIEMKVCNNKLYIGEFQLLNEKMDNTIYLFEPNKSNFKKIYNSQSYHIGQLTCSHKENALFFIKQVGKSNNTEIFKLSLKDYQLKQYSDLKTVNHLYKMDQRIFTNIGDKIYHVETSQTKKN
jgi:hypothetical protein